MSHSNKSSNYDDNDSVISSIENLDNVSSYKSKSKSNQKPENSVNKYTEYNFKEKIINYIKIDDTIRKKREEIKELNAKKEAIDEYILKYLDKNDSNFVNIPGGKLIKSQSETKGPLKLDTIKSSIEEGIKKDNLTTSEEISKKILDDIIEIMEIKRGKVRRVNLKRTFERTKKKKTNK